MHILLATGLEELDRSVSQELARWRISTSGECYYREGLVALARQKNADVVVLSPHLLGQTAIVEVVKQLRLAGIRVIFLPGHKDDPQAQAQARKIVALGVYDLVWDPVSPASVVSRTIRPATLAEAAVEPEGHPHPPTSSSEKKRTSGFWQRLFGTRKKKKPSPTPQDLAPFDRKTPETPITTVAVGISLPGIPTVERPPYTAALVFFSPEKASRAVLPPGAKGYIVGSNAMAWRQAAVTGFPVVSEGKATAMIPSASNGRKAYCTVFYSSSTAVGKTSAAFTMAALLAQKGRKTCLVDIDTGKPALTYLVTGEYTTIGNMEAPLPTPWGFNFVPHFFGDETEIREAQKAVARLLTAYEEVVVDCPGRLNLLPYMEAFLRTANTVVLLSDCTAAAVATVHSFVRGKMRELEIGPKTMLVVNQKVVIPPLKPKEVAERVSLPLSLVLPYDPFVERMFAQRQPLPYFRTRKPMPFLRAIESLAATQISATPNATASAGKTP